MTDENPSSIIVNMHGLLGEQEVVQIEIEAERLVEEEQFVFQFFKLVTPRKVLLPLYKNNITPDCSN